MLFILTILCFLGCGSTESEKPQKSATNDRVVSGDAAITTKKTLRQKTAAVTVEKTGVKSDDRDPLKDPPEAFPPLSWQRDLARSLQPGAFVIPMGRKWGKMTTRFTGDLGKKEFTFKGINWYSQYEKSPDIFLLDGAEIEFFPLGISPPYPLSKEQRDALRATMIVVPGVIGVKLRVSDNFLSRVTVRKDSEQSWESFVKEGKKGLRERISSTLKEFLEKTKR